MGGVIPNPNLQDHRPPPLSYPNVGKHGIETGTQRSVIKACLWAVPIAIAFCYVSSLILGRLP